MKNLIKAIVLRGGEYKCRIGKMHLKLIDQQPKIIIYFYKLHGNHKPKIHNRYIYIYQKRKMNPIIILEITSNHRRKETTMKPQKQPQTINKWQ